MTKDEIRKLMVWIESRVELAADGVGIAFDEPGSADFRARGFDDEVIAATLGSSWWAEMATDIVETPEYAEPGESPDQILGYARDVVSEYIRKRLDV
jgi:hypothetical protein